MNKKIREFLEVKEMGRKNKTYMISLIEVKMDSFGKLWHDIHILWCELHQWQINTYLMEELMYYKCPIKLVKISNNKRKIALDF